MQDINPAPFYCSYSFYLGKESGRWIRVAIAKKPKTTKVPKPNKNPRIFLFFKALMTAKTANNATNKKIIAVPMYKKLLSVGPFHFLCIDYSYSHLFYSFFVDLSSDKSDTSLKAML